MGLLLLIVLILFLAGGLPNSGNHSYGSLGARRGGPDHAKPIGARIHHRSKSTDPTRLNLRTDRDSNGIISRPFLPAAEWRSTNMAEWIEVPAHRIYVICARELRDGFDYIRENGRPAAHGENPYRLVRKKDGKVFKLARFIPQYSGVHDYTALEEI